MTQAVGKIFKITRYAIHDGPGIRTAVFMKGCPLRCLWCSSPESHNFESEAVWNKRLCALCGRCTAGCPQNALSLDGLSIRIDRNSCVKCGECARRCPNDAITVCGHGVTPPELLESVGRDAPFWRRSHGGVTISGGEAAAQPRFLLDFLKLCRAKSVHTAIETCLFAARETISEMANLVDFWQFDIKAMSPSLHERLTSVGNENILRNAEYLLKKNVPLLARYPLVPGCNDDEGELDALGDFLARNRPGTVVEILPYHRMGVGMYEALGVKYALPSTAPPTKLQTRRAAAILGKYPIEVIFR